MIIFINGSMSYECVKPMTHRSVALPTAIKVYLAHIKCTHTIKQFQVFYATKTFR